MQNVCVNGVESKYVVSDKFTGWILKYVHTQVHLLLTLLKIILFIVILQCESFLYKFNILTLRYKKGFFYFKLSEHV